MFFLIVEPAAGAQPKYVIDQVNSNITVRHKSQPQAQQPVRVGGSLVDPATGEEVYREPTEMAEFDEFARNRFRGSDAYPGDGASNEEIEKAYQSWFKKEYPSK